MRFIFAALLFALTVFITIELSSQSDKVPPNQEIPPKNKRLPARRINNRRFISRRPAIPGIITFSDSSSNSRESEEFSSPRQSRSRSPSPTRRIILHPVDSEGSTNDRQNQERFVHTGSPSRERVLGSPVHSSVSSNEPEIDEGQKKKQKNQ